MHVARLRLWQYLASKRESLQATKPGSTSTNYQLHLSFATRLFSFCMRFCFHCCMQCFCGQKCLGFAFLQRAFTALILTEGWRKQIPFFSGIVLKIPPAPQEAAACALLVSFSFRPSALVVKRHKRVSVHSRDSAASELNISAPRAAFGSCLLPASSSPQQKDPFTSLLKSASEHWERMGKGDEMRTAMYHHFSPTCLKKKRCVSLTTSGDAVAWS